MIPALLRCLNPLHKGELPAIANYTEAEHPLHHKQRACLTSPQYTALPVIGSEKNNISGHGPQWKKKGLT